MQRRTIKTLSIAGAITVGGVLLVRWISPTDEQVIEVIYDKA